MTAPEVTTGETVPSALLREQTADDHQRAERSVFQRQLVSGKLPRALYWRFLNEMLHVWRTLDASVSALRERAEFAPLVDRSRFRLADIERDLSHFAVATAPPLPATVAFCDRIRGWAVQEPMLLAGVLYVLEGSTNGGHYIARNVRRAYGLDGAAGTAFLDPYGADQPARWAAWKDAFDAVVPAAAAGALVPVAQETFRSIEAVGADVLAREA